MTIKHKIQIGIVALGVSGMAFMLSTSANATEPSVLYDANGNAVVAYLTCEKQSTAVVLYTHDEKPIAAYLECAGITATKTTVVVVPKKVNPIISVVTGTRAIARRTARRVSNRKNND